MVIPPPKILADIYLKVHISFPKIACAGDVTVSGSSGGQPLLFLGCCFSRLSSVRQSLEYGGFLGGFYQNTKTEKRKTLIC
jgi:hypothetical protein